jgi:CMP-N,N'-diacetyllegionaminic acid synthase
VLGSKQVLAVIPARGNSKRLPGKNLKLMNGVSLLERAIKLAAGSKFVDHVVVSSEDNDILKHAEDYGADVIKRPEGLSKDTSATIEAVLHACDMLVSYDVVVLLQPTSPLRASSDLELAFNKMLEAGAEQVISVCEVDHPVQWNVQLSEKSEISFIHSVEERSKRSQDYKPIYRLNGAIYISDIDFLNQSKTFVSDDAVACVMPRERSVDIDTFYDFYLAESIEKIINK